MLYKDKSKSIKLRVKDLLKRMTFEEKSYQLTSTWSYELLKRDFSLDIGKLKDKFPHGLGQITRIGGGTPTIGKDLPKLHNDIQRYFMTETRLQIPVMFHEESCSGAMFEGATNFPQAIGIASTFNSDLCEDMAEIIGKELKSVGCNQTLAPLLDVTREPRWGRLEETFGEDVYLVTQMGIAYIRGIQKNGVYATGKHFVAYGAAEKGFNWAPAQVPARTLREVYLATFEAAIKEGKLASIMPAYQENDGEPCHSSRLLLKNILRQEWGFDGLVVTDYSGLNLLKIFHKLYSNFNSIAKRAIECEIDMELPTQAVYGKILFEEINKGNIDTDSLDKIVSRILTKKFELDLFDNPYVEEIPNVVIRNKENLDKAFKITRESLVLLENKNDILPLKTGIKIALIGPNANSIRNQLGDYAFKAHVECLVSTLKDMEVNKDNNNAAGFTMQEKVDLDSKILDNFIKEINGSSVYSALVRRIGKDNVLYSKGSDIFETNDRLLEEAISTANRADIIIAVLGDKSGLDEGSSSGESRDRETLDLLRGQDKLLRELKKLGKSIILVLIHGRPMSISWAKKNMDAIIASWLPGEQGGEAICDVMFGDYNPGGKLPITFPNSVGQLPIYYSHKPSAGAERLWGGYVDGTHDPLYYFGYGLSYTKFELSNFEIDKTEVYAGETVKISCTVKNVGKREGSEVVQLYIRNNARGVTRPVKELKGFNRVNLKQNESKIVVFELPVNIIGFYDENMCFSIQETDIDIMIGTSSKDIIFKNIVHIANSAKIKDKVFTTKTYIL